MVPLPGDVFPQANFLFRQVWMRTLSQEAQSHSVLPTKHLLNLEPKLINPAILFIITIASR